MKVIQVNQTAKHRASEDEKIIRQRFQQIVSYFKTKKIRNKKELLAKKEVTIVFLTEKQMQKINHQFRGYNKPTDILSFSSTDKKSLGELLLCVAVLIKQAKEHDHSLEREMFYMLIHGLLHLLGYDHEISLAEEKLMFKLQDNCFRQLV